MLMLTLYDDRRWEEEATTMENTCMFRYMYELVKIADFFCE